LISALALVVIAVVAVIDHRAKQHAVSRASVASWFCTHRGLRCGEETPQRIGERWHRRERIYQVSVALVLVIGGSAVLIPMVRRRSAGPSSNE
jgi:hypothetical protein